MNKNFVEELKWRGMIHDIMPGAEEKLNSGQTSGYIGFDPTADSLHIGNLVQIMTLVHFQRSGHKPIALVGGATGMVGDPSGKSQERNLLNIETLNHNVQCVQKQLEKFLDFSSSTNGAEIVNNYDWFQNFSFLDFIRDVGKLLTINYMLAKDSVKNRLENGMSFTEFSYQLIQGYDFYWLFENKNCVIQLGGSDQWGNIVTGTELIRKKTGKEAFAITTPLIKKADGSKFGKSEQGNIWLDAEKTSPYQFYQYWLNVSDDDAVHFIKIFTLFEKDEIFSWIEAHQKEPHLRILQKKLAEDITQRVHGLIALESAKLATEILFGKSNKEDLEKLNEKDFFALFEGVPIAELNKDELGNGLSLIDALSAKSQFLPSNAEAKRELKSNSISVNKNKIGEDYLIKTSDLIHGKYVLLSKGKKNNYLIKFS
ncbi:MAG: tyrosine--tRNA ligase [Flavobacteriia bacterium]|nr:tyrosine--tRNA ligase [Flavobacteriia bacterium]